MTNRRDPDKPYYECPRFDSCSVNSCLLDPEQRHRTNLPGEESCSLAKVIRARIGEKYSKVLKFKGLTSREWKGKERWDALPPDQKKLIVTRASKLGKSAVQPTPEVTLSPMSNHLEDVYGRAK